MLLLKKRYGRDFFTKMSLNTSTIIKENYSNNKLIKVVDIFGRESTEKKNSILFFIYNDGVIEKKIIME